jgi:hypothetical protein
LEEPDLGEEDYAKLTNREDFVDNYQFVYEVKTDCSSRELAMIFISSQVYPVHIFSLYDSKIRFNIIIQSRNE